MKRIIIAGRPGSGKTTFARQVAKQMDLTHIEFDGIYWLENWQEPDISAFRAKLQAEMEKVNNGWVICGGGLGRSGGIHWDAADTVIRLNIPTPLLLTRVFWRSLKRVVTREKIWGTNQESIKNAFFSRKSVLHAVWKDRKNSHIRFAEMKLQFETPHRKFFEFSSNRAARNWLERQPKS